MGGDPIVQKGGGGGGDPIVQKEGGGGGLAPLIFHP